MAQHNSSGFGRGWIPMERDIGLPGEERPHSPLPPAGGPESHQYAGGFAAGAAFAAAHPNPSRRREGLTIGLPFTPDRQVRFLHHLAVTGNVRRACALVGVSAQAAYVHKRRDHAFAHGWHAALLLARDAAEEVLAERALNGTQETIFYRGEAVGHRVRFDARLLLAHLARLDSHAAQAEAAAPIAARFDDYLAELHEAGQPGEGPAFAPPDEDFEAPPLWTPLQPTREEALLAARQSVLYAFPERVEDLPPETLAECAAGDPRDLWSRALAHTQHRAETAAAEAWDAEAATRLTMLDALFEEQDAPPPGPPHFCEVQMASSPSGPPHFCEAQMGRWQPAGLTEGQPRPETPSEPAEGGERAETAPDPVIETKSAKFPQDPVNRVNLGALAAVCPAALARSGAVARRVSSRPVRPARGSRG